MTDKLTRLERAFCEKGNLQEYQETLRQLIEKVLDFDCLISDCDTCETSYIEQSSEEGIKNHIRISFKYKKEKPIHYIWDIIHEFGHHLSGHPNGKEKSIEREIEAWNIGQNILKEYPNLLFEENDFIEYRNHCLNSYYKKHYDN